MSDFEAEMHKIRFPPGLRHRPHWGAFSAPPDLLAVFKGAYFERVGRGEDGRGRGGKGKGNGRGGGVTDGKGGNGRGQPPQIFCPRTAPGVTRAILN